MGWLIALLVLAAIVFGLWLWGRLVDGATEIAFAVLLWPFAKLISTSMTNHAVTVLRTPQRFQVSSGPEQVGQTLTALPDVMAEPPQRGAAPFYREVQPGRIVIGVGNVHSCDYNLEVRFVEGWPGTCGEVRYLSWKRDPRDEMALQHNLLDTVFHALRSLDTQLYVTTGVLSPAQSDGGPPIPAPIGPVSTDPPPQVRLGPAWPATRTVGVAAAAHSVPVIPAVAVAVLVIALVVGITSALGVFHTTTRSELCSAYRTAAAQFVPSSITSDEEFDKAMDDSDMTDELKSLKDRAESYDDDGVKKDADDIDDLGMLFSQSSFDSATEHIAAIC